MQIKKLTQKDWQLWKEFRLEALKNSPESFGSSYEEELNWSDVDFQQTLTKNDIFGIIIHNSLVSCASFYSLHVEKMKHRGFIWGMYTQPHYRGKSYASAIIQAIIKHAKSHVTQLHLTCVTSNINAVSFYQKHGFKTYGTEPRALKIGNTFFDEHLMALDLTEASMNLPRGDNMTAIQYPSPNTLYPINGVTRTVFLKNIIHNPQIIVGDYTYYDDPEDVHNFKKNVLYLFDFMGDKLVIGKFCQIATGVRFIMNGSNHAMSGFSTYPFKVFGEEWSKKDPMHVVSKGDTMIGNDVWIGNSATIMQGIKIGDGAIIGTNSLVTKDVEPYTIVGGNPAKEIRKRFDDETVNFLVNLKWWDWSVESITEHLELITNGNLNGLKKIYNKSYSFSKGS